jgi:hypothetical protein
VLGKFFFKRMTPEEIKVWRSKCTGVIEDVRTDQEMIDFGLKMKALDGKFSESSSVKSYYFPNLN